ncbi:hypothetical protein [Salinispora sp. H7-4]|uniref:hypothetical protein n=1 Tax=Salinispora sp. H7-4 TaxID=2748321 RepID=UPI0015D421AF|nr:hypothetical protein [Salinispora sp. H7-4]NYT95839.1 hypothetical protein [Salinispora sp. H7-4]
MGRKRLVAVTTVAALGLGILGLWQWAPWSERAALPTCDEVATMLPDTVPGSWTVTHDESNVPYIRRCEFDLTSADQAYMGEVRISIVDGGDATMLQKGVTGSTCFGEEIPFPGAEQYRASRFCSTRINDKVLTTVYVASEQRYTHVLASLTGPDRSEEQTFSYTDDTVQRIADFSMALTTDEGTR